MIRTMIIDTEGPDGEKKPIQFYGLSAIEYYLGWNSSKMGMLEKMGLVPRTPYIKECNYKVLGRDRVGFRLYTRTQLIEFVNLVEGHYPVLYRGRQILLKAAYQQSKEIYKGKVKELQEKWEREDYLAKEPATYRPLTAWEKKKKIIDIYILRKQQQKGEAIDPESELRECNQ